MTDSVVQILREAKDAIATKGWYQGGYTDPNQMPIDEFGSRSQNPMDAKCFCAIGAVAYAMKLEHFALAHTSRPKFVLQTALAKRFKIPDAYMASIPVYNDVVGRSVEEILSLFDEAIELAKEDNE